MALIAALSPDDRRALRRHMRVPVISFAALMMLLGVNVLLGALLPFRNVWIVEAAVVACMVLVILVFSMELTHEPPIIRFFSGLGFVWVCILFTMTLIDYLTR